MLHLIDVVGYRLLTEMWPLLWPMLAAVGVCALIERRFPLASSQGAHAWWFNIAWHAFVLSFMVVLSWGAWGRFLLWAGSAAWLPSPLAPPAGATDGFLRAVVALLVHDFLTYWVHRLQHAWPLLWPIHRFHHDERHLNASTSLRNHWLGALLGQVLVLVPMMWLLGIDAMSPALYVFLGVFAAWSHLNIDIRLGPLSTLIVGPRYHRVHHSRTRDLHDGNYAAVLPLWDILFRTHHAPVPGRPADVGLADVAPSASMWRAAVAPLVDWAALLRGRTPAS